MIMKFQIDRFFLFGLLVLSVSCGDFLDRQPLDQITIDNFFTSANDADKALIACYIPLESDNWTGKGWQITEIPTDNAQPGGTDPGFTPIDNFTVAADNEAVAAYWSAHYQMVTLTNAVIEAVEVMTLEESKKALFLAEARFLRAFAYFDLVRIYGPVPLITNPPKYGENLLFPRSSVADVYAQIISDLEFAAELLPIQWSGTNVGRASRGAAWALLAKVYLTNRQFVPARNAARNCMDLGRYDLMDRFADNFELSTSDNNRESIFQVQYVGCGPFGTGNQQQAFYAPWGEGITKNRDGWGSQIPTGPTTNNPNTTVYDIYENTDLRRDPTIMTPNTFYPSINPDDGGYTYPNSGASASGINIKKYVVGAGPNICFMSTPQNSHIIRYSDVLLTYAEAIMEIEGGVSTNSEALEAFNRVRTRAGLEALTMIDREIMLHERRLEFAFEGHRWFDLIRSGRIIEIMTLHGKQINTHNVLFPIPAAEIEINPELDQNPGY